MMTGVSGPWPGYARSGRVHKKGQERLYTH